MRGPIVALLAAVLLCGCQTASYSAGMQLAGTFWRATDRAAKPGGSYQGLSFSSKLTPAGMGQVSYPDGSGGLFQIIDGKLVLRNAGRDVTYAFEVKGDTLTLERLSPDGAVLSTQHFAKQ